jgi:hypothetical protein
MNLSTISKIDPHCLVATILFLLSDLLAIIAFFLVANVNGFDFAKLLDLDPTFIQKEWEWMNKHFGINLTHELLNCFAWFILAMPSYVILCFFRICSCTHALFCAITNLSLMF